MDRLALVSRLLLDQRVLDLRNENERLRCKIKALELALFWKDHNMDRLKAAMQNACRCSCFVCVLAGRATHPGATRCTFKPWFEAQLARCGMTVGHLTTESPAVTLEHIDENHLYSVNTHLHHLSGRADWLAFSYGAPVWQAESADDPELEKLRRLFRILNNQ